MNRVIAILCLFTAACTAPTTTPTRKYAGGEAYTHGERPRWAIAIHGGAGAMDKDSPPEKIAEAEAALREALNLGRAMLQEGRSGLDTVEAVIQVMENHPRFNAGKGAVFTADGRHELDASIMDGFSLSCGAVTGVTTIKNPIRLARRVMEKTRHVLLGQAGAEAFADTQADIERVDPSYFSTPHRERSLEQWRKRQAQAGIAPDPNRWKSTVGCVVLDKQGHLAAGTSTGGMTGKRFGRIGDSPIIGAGTYADDRTCAVSCTGTGEEYIRHGVARDIADRMRYLGVTAQTAAEAVIQEVLQPDDGGVIAIGRDGSIVMEYNTEGMFRGAANSLGRFEIGIWDTTKP